MSKSTDDEKKLQVAVRNSIICACRKSKLLMNKNESKGAALYFCKRCSDDMIFCNNCGPALHTIYEHDWNGNSLISINKIVAAQANSNDLQVLCNTYFIF